MDTNGAFKHERMRGRENNIKGNYFKASLGCPLHQEILTLNKNANLLCTSFWTQLWETTQIHTNGEQDTNPAPPHPMSLSPFSHLTLGVLGEDRQLVQEVAILVENSSMQGEFSTSHIWGAIKP